MRRFFSERSPHTWIGTIASIISIVAYLTGIQTIYQVGSLTFGSINFAWEQPSLGLTIALLILNLVFVWGAFCLITTTILAFANTSVFFEKIAPVIFFGISLAIGFWNFDAFFYIHALIDGFLSAKKGGGATELELMCLGPLMIFFLPLFALIFAHQIAGEWGCGRCGRVALEYVSSRDSRVKEERTRAHDANGTPVMRIQRLQPYDVRRRCRACGTEWIFHKTRSLGYTDYPTDHYEDE